MLLPLSASHAHSLANLRKTPDEVVAELARIRAARDAAGSQDADRGRRRHGLRLHASRARSKPAEVLRLMQALLDAGADRVSLADTVGYADPAHGARPVRAGAEDRRRPLLLRPLPRHARPGAGQRLCRARSWASRRFDASLAGIGGCPHAPGASGNASTEDLAFMLASMGVDTGIDLDALLALRAKVAGWLRRRDPARRAVARRPAEDLSAAAAAAA